MNTLLKKLSTIGIVPVIALPKVEDALPLAAALKNGGLPCMEITFRTKACLPAIQAIRASHPDIIVGAGTVLSTEQADAAVAAGAQFIVTPGMNPEVLHHCVDRDYPIIPGCSNPGDVEQAIACGLKIVKLFPAEAVGGLKLISAMAGPYSDVKFFPTGGINASNIKAYLKNPQVLCCGGTWMVPQDAIVHGHFDTIEALTRSAVNTMLDFDLAHIGIYCDDSAGAEKAAQNFSTLFGFELDNRSGSIFAGDSLELMKDSSDSRGHIAIGTGAIMAAVGSLERRGFTLDWETAHYKDDGSLSVIYINEKIGGFTLHLLAR